MTIPPPIVVLGLVVGGLLILIGLSLIVQPNWKHARWIFSIILQLRRVRVRVYLATHGSISPPDPDSRINVAELLSQRLSLEVVTFEPQLGDTPHLDFIVGADNRFTGHAVEITGQTNGYLRSPSMGDRRAHWVIRRQTLGKDHQQNVRVTWHANREVMDRWAAEAIRTGQIVLDFRLMEIGLAIPDLGAEEVFRPIDTRSQVEFRTPPNSPLARRGAELSPALSISVSEETKLLEMPAYGPDDPRPGFPIQVSVVLRPNHGAIHIAAIELVCGKARVPALEFRPKTIEATQTEILHFEPAYEQIAQGMERDSSRYFGRIRVVNGGQEWYSPVFQITGPLPQERR